MARHCGSVGGRGPVSGDAVAVSHVLQNQVPDLSLRRPPRIQPAQKGFGRRCWRHRVIELHFARRPCIPHTIARRPRLQDKRGGCILCRPLVGEFEAHDVRRQQVAPWSVVTSRTRPVESAPSQRKASVRWWAWSLRASHRRGATLSRRDGAAKWQVACLGRLAG